MKKEHIPFPQIVKEQMILTTGGPHDKTRCYAPGLLKFGDKYLMYYTGSNDNPSSRSGYRLLLARSDDGINFQKTNTPVLDLFPTAKSYSAEAHLEDDGRIKLYFSLNEGDGYRIYCASTDNPEGPLSQPELLIDKTSLFSSSVHTLRLIEHNGIRHSYVAGSCNGEKSQSRKYRSYRISSDFRIFHSASKDIKDLGQFREIGLPSHQFINIYGHSVFMHENVLYLIFSGFDGSGGCKLFISGSTDFGNFSEPELLFEPEEANGEIGAYSSHVLPVNDREWRLYYASRALWKYRGIASARITF